MFRNLRRAWQVWALALFVVLVLATSASLLGRHPVGWFLQLDPLVALTTALASRTLWKGLLWSLPVLVLTLVFGRAFCGWLCPMGVMHQLTSFLFRRRKAADRIKANQPRPAQKVKYYVLLVMLGMAALGSTQIGVLDPIASSWRALATTVVPALGNALGGAYQGERHFQFGSLITLSFFGVLALNAVWPRFFCRVLCPLGGLLGLTAKLSLFRIARDKDKCNLCTLCNDACQGAADPMGTCRTTECMVCLNCVAACPQGAMAYRFLPGDDVASDKVDLPRRRWVTSAACGIAAVPLMRASTGVDPRPHPERIRPPGAVDEPDFLEKCLKCGACMKVCPTGGLQPALREAGLEGLWTPVLVPRIGYCEHSCVLCTQVCPTGALVPLTVGERQGLAAQEEPVRLGSAYFDRGRCLPWANDTECIVCEEVCPTSPKAIFFKLETVVTREGETKVLKRPHVNLDLCIGCGICEARCPVFDRAAVRVSSVGETRSQTNRITLGGRI